MAAQRDTVLNAAVVIVATCAVVTTSLAAVRAFRPPPPVSPPAAVEIKDWRRYAAVGHRLGPAEAAVTIVEFSDFQCPFCRAAAATLKSLRIKYNGQVALVYRHFPLERVHSLARPAAIASECADRQGRFESFHDALFAADSLRASGWTKLAHQSGVRDTVAFAACLRDPVGGDAVDKDVIAGTELKVRGTPTILVNQYRITGGAQPDILDSLIRLALRPR